MYVLNKLVDKGNIVLVIEHNMAVIKICVYLIDVDQKAAMVVET
jgi:excinuclease UvrABC ATPase subunit